MRKHTKPKPLALTTHTLKQLTAPELAALAGGASYNGSVNLACYLSGASICPLC